MRLMWGQPVVAWPDRLRPNIWDLVAFPLVLGGIALLAWGGSKMDVPYRLGDPLPISLDPAVLPYYALRTVLRMFAGLAVSLVFSFAYAALAAKSRQAEKLLIPLLDLLQSVPILGFLSITITGFIALFPGSLLGVECAAIFAIFTSQAWNMTFSLYQSFRTVPNDLREAARMYHLGPWAAFWRLEVPHAMPSLLWNMMMSVSGGWFFVVASEAITVSSQTILLPGVGSYIAQAIDQRNLEAVGYAVLVMFIVILIYDQLLFRPLLAWSVKFRSEEIAGEEPERPWFLTLLQRAHIVDLLDWMWELMRAGFLRVLQALPRLPVALPETTARGARIRELVWDTLLRLVALGIAVRLGFYVTQEVGLHEVLMVFGLGLVTALRVLILIALASVI